MAITPQHEKGEPTEADLQHAYDKARSIGLFLVEKYAREVLRQEHLLSEFVMANGAYYFKSFAGRLATEVRTEAGFTLAGLIREWGSVLKLTGEPMRFTADGPVRREW